MCGECGAENAGPQRQTHTRLWLTRRGLLGAHPEPVLGDGVEHLAHEVVDPPVEGHHLRVGSGVSRRLVRRVRCFLPFCSRGLAPDNVQLTMRMRAVPTVPAAGPVTSNHEPAALPDSGEHTQNRPNIPKSWGGFGCAAVSSNPESRVETRLGQCPSTTNSVCSRPWVRFTRAPHLREGDHGGGVAPEPLGPQLAVEGVADLPDGRNGG